MLDPDEAEWAQDEDQDEFCNSQGAFHDEEWCTDMKEFSELIARVPFKVLWMELMTNQQRLLATALWEACNYGGKPTPGDLKYMEKKQDYAAWVLRMDHRQQYAKAKKKR